MLRMPLLFHTIVLECRKEIVLDLDESLFAIPHIMHYLDSLVRVLPEQNLKVSWKPSEDAGQSAITYIVTTTTTDMDYMNSTSVTHAVTSAITDLTISGLPQYSVGTVSVWAKNRGTLSKPVILRFRMVNIVTIGKYT